MRGQCLQQMQLVQPHDAQKVGVAAHLDVEPLPEVRPGHPVAVFERREVTGALQFPFRGDDGPRDAVVAAGEDTDHLLHCGRLSGVQVRGETVTDTVLLGQRGAVGGCAAVGKPVAHRNGDDDSRLDGFCGEQHRVL